MPFVIALPLSVMAALALVVLAACYQTALEMIADWIDRTNHIHALEAEYAKWYDKYLSCDNFGGAVDKGKAAAMCVVLKAMIDEA